MKRRYIIAAALALLLALTGCKAEILEADASAMLTKGYIEVKNEKDVVLSEDVKEAFKSEVYKFDHTPRILIYHTHATEAYRMEGDYTYAETEPWRTEDNTKNVVYAGEVLAEELRALGFEVLHDTTNVEHPDFNSAYSRSLEVMESYEDIDIYLDLHRNAADAEKAQNDVVMLDGKRCARMFFVVGTGIGTYEGEYDVRPDWVRSYTLANSLSEKLRETNAELADETRVKVGRYNQHVGLCMLAEVGHNANTLDDILNTLPYFAKAIGEVCKW